METRPFARCHVGGHIWLVGLEKLSIVSNGFARQDGLAYVFLDCNCVFRERDWRFAIDLFSRADWAGFVPWRLPGYPIFNPASFAFLDKAFLIHQIFQPVLQRSPRRTLSQFVGDVSYPYSIRVAADNGLDGFKFFFGDSFCHGRGKLAYRVYTQLNHMYAQISSLCANINCAKSQETSTPVQQYADPGQANFCAASSAPVLHARRRTGRPEAGDSDAREGQRIVARDRQSAHPAKRFGGQAQKRQARPFLGESVRSYRFQPIAHIVLYAAKVY